MHPRQIFVAVKNIYFMYIITDLYRYINTLESQSISDSQTFLSIFFRLKKRINEDPTRGPAQGEYLKVDHSAPGSA